MFTVRKMVLEDLDACTELFIRVFSNEPWHDEWKSFYHARTYLEDFTKMPRFIGFVAEKDEQVVAMAMGHVRKWWQGDEYFIYELCVDTSNQRTGVGTKLMREIKDMLRKEDVGFITLLTERDIPAEAFFKKNGFNESNTNLFMFTKV